MIKLFRFKVLLAIWMKLFPLCCRSHFYLLLFYNSNELNALCFQYVVAVIDCNFFFFFFAGKYELFSLHLGQSLGPSFDPMSRQDKLGLVLESCFTRCHKCMSPYLLCVFQAHACTKVTSTVLSLQPSILTSGPRSWPS